MGRGPRPGDASQPPCRHSTLATGDGFQGPSMPTDVVDTSNREYDMREAVASMIFGGVFERYPRLHVGAVEFEVAWAPYFMGRMDNVYTERAVGVHGRRFKDGALPSDFFRRNIFISFQEDDLGIQLRAHIGVENLLWGSDYPHAESTFPRSREIVARILRGFQRWNRHRSLAETPQGCITSATWSRSSRKQLRYGSDQQLILDSRDV